ncbi:hypothetical protein L7F22_052338 [Adiantum nelumboides]|nr:hypothetical protein [Adiantum nelumboides]
MPHMKSVHQSREKEVKSPNVSMENVASPKRKRSPHSPPPCISNREGKKLTKKKERKRSPSSPSSSPSPSFDESSGYFSKESQRRGYKRSHAAWKRANNPKKFKEEGKNISFLTYDDAYDPLDPNGNITITWDIMTWTDDGYMASVTIRNYQKYRFIERPGWRLGWHWRGEEIIWTMDGAEAEMQGDCSLVTPLKKPHNCERAPKVVDLFPGQTLALYDPNNPVGIVANCCKGGVIAAWEQDPSRALASFQMKVGSTGNTRSSIRFPVNFTLEAPGPGYSCGPPAAAPPTLFPDTDGRRHTQAMLTWNIICTYSKFLATDEPSCCVSLSAFYSEVITPCRTCACACAESAKSNVECAKGSFIKQAVVTPTQNLMEPVLQCTKDMCPIQIHWHVKQNYVSYWRVKLTVLNQNYAQNYSNWNVVAQHPGVRNLSQVFSFDYKLLTPYKSPSDVVLLWGIPSYNDVLMNAGEGGNVQTEVLFQKDPDTFTFRNGWAFPHKIYFNGHECVLPLPDSYPALPSASSTVGTAKRLISGLVFAAILL